MHNKSVLLVLVLLLAVATTWAYPFRIGKQGVTPPPGLRLASLRELQTTLLDTFLRQYNSVGLPVQSNTITGNCCMFVAESAWLYVPGVGQYLYPCVNGLVNCTYTVQGSMKWGAYDTGCYNSVSEKDVLRWSLSSTCVSPSYAVWVWRCPP